MKYFGGNNDKIYGECEKCKKVFALKKEVLTLNQDVYFITNTFKCTCETIHETITDVKNTSISASKSNIQLTKCKTCNREISINATKCPYCGEQLKKETNIFWTIVLAIVVAVVIISLG